MSKTLTTLRFNPTKGIFACKSVADTSLCTVDKWSLLFRCSESVILRLTDSKVEHELSEASVVPLRNRDPPKQKALLVSGVSS